MRIGLAERFELRLGWEGWLEEEVTAGPVQRERVDGCGRRRSWAPRSSCARATGLSPAIALLAATSVPVGDERVLDRPLRSRRCGSRCRTIFAGGIGLGYNVGVETASDPAADGGHTTLATAIYTLVGRLPRRRAVRACSSRLRRRADERRGRAGASARRRRDLPAAAESAARRRRRRRASPTTRPTGSPASGSRFAFRAECGRPG